jgi:flavin reductase (DIM6/NTAB) family NADH-FMN oxidoreductase RutF
MTLLEITKFNQNDDAIKLRKILGQFATGVAIVTTNNSDELPCGITINSLTSVSLSPPLILFCLSKQSGTMPSFQKSKMFAINILDGEQKELSQHFAKANIDKFKEINWHKSENGLPIFHGNIATFECQKTNEFDGGDHIIIIGEVINAWGHESHDPLIYHDGKYKKIHI